MKTRSCRRTRDEDLVHEKAVKLRKMTDEKLIDYIEKEKSDAFERGREKGVEEAVPVPGETESVLTADDKYEVKHFIEMLSDLPGIGFATMAKVVGLARREGYIDDREEFH